VVGQDLPGETKNLNKAKGGDKVAKEGALGGPLMPLKRVCIGKIVEGEERHATAEKGKNKRGLRSADP